MVTEVPEKDAERRFSRKVLLLLVAGFAAVLVTVLASGLANRRTQEQTQWLVHTYKVERQVGTLRLALERLRSARRGVVLGLSRADANYTSARTDLIASIELVHRSTVDNPIQQRNLRELRGAAVRLTRLFDISVANRERHDRVAEAARQQTALQVQRLAERMLAEETKLLQARDAELQRSITISYAVSGAMLVLILAIGIGSFFVIGRYTRELAGTRDALRNLNANLEGAVRERTTDLQRANDEIQRFAYIVSHDLRSPLVNIMGFTSELDAATKPLARLIERASEEAPDLVSEDARLAATEDLPESIRFIRTSTEKMDRLINAILRLSREGRRPITPERLALEDVVGSILDSLKHRIDQAGIEVRFGTLPSIVSDRVSLEQILSNLVENAIKYLKPGVPGRIDISGNERGNRVIIAIADNGRGIEKRDHERIFDLFRRSGTQDQPGEGIGLAHVRALAYRLGGTIDVESELGTGSTFRVNLPAVFAGERGQEK